jgi:membrane fusion protein (multidrug efflux system)
MNTAAPVRSAPLRFPRPLVGLVLAVSAATLPLSGCGRSEAGKPAASDSSPAVAVEVVRPVRGEMAAVYSGTAPIEAEQQATVVAKVGGEVRRLLVDEGDRVRAGQVLAILDGDRLRLEVAQTRATLAKLERDYARTTELQAKGLVGRAAAENLKYEIDAQRAAHDMAALQLSYTEIRAPIAGVIAERHVKAGNTLQPNAPLFAIVNPDPLVTYVHVPERELHKLAAGQPAQAQVDAAGGAFAAKIRRISPVVDPATGTFKVTLELDDAQARLKPGMFARVNIVYERRRDVLQVPRAAIVDADAGALVYVVEKGKAVAKTVTTGLTNGGVVEIVRGLKGDEQVVVVGQNGLKAGNDVRVVDPVAPAKVAARTR